MKPDLYTKAVLTIIALLLAVIALRFEFTPFSVHAAPAHKYAAEGVQGGELVNVMNRYAADGWEVVTAYGDASQHFLIFKK